MSYLQFLGRLFLAWATVRSPGSAPNSALLPSVGSEGRKNQRQKPRSRPYQPPSGQYPYPDSGNGNKWIEPCICSLSVSRVGSERLPDKPEISGSNPLVPAKNKPLIASGLFRWCQRDSSLSFRLARESLSGQPASGVMVANPESSVSSCSSRDAASGVPAAANSFFRTEIFSAS